jgi:lipoprotein-anchoring transpeptidase ErfK/SrfK
MRFISVKTRLVACLLAGLATGSAAFALPPTSDRFDDLVIGGTQLYVPPVEAPSRAIAIRQIMLDRAGFSPGVIDGLSSDRLRAALAAHKTATGRELTVSDEDRASAFQAYTITQADISARFTPDLPPLYIHQAGLSWLGFRDTREMLAERFHVDEAYLVELNPDADFTRPGTVITVPDIGRDLQIRVSRIEADKSARQLRAYDAKDRLIAAYPASIGSRNTPSPSGTHRVRNKAQNPAYTYDPQGSAQPGLADGLVLLPPGPNGPVGDAWIGLSKKTYGIHGTPEPSRIGITSSVGCIRLTNWDALELARLVRNGITVAFID